MTTPLIHGTLESLVLRTLAEQPRHGYAIVRHLEDTGGDVLSVGEGSLYPALYRMEKRGWIKAEWRASELGRRAKVYRLTPEGRRQLDKETARWKAFAAAVGRVLLPGEQ